MLLFLPVLALFLPDHSRARMCAYLKVARRHEVLVPGLLYEAQHLLGHEGLCQSYGVVLKFVKLQLLFTQHASGSWCLWQLLLLLPGILLQSCNLHQTSIRWTYTSALSSCIYLLHERLYELT